MRQPAYKTIFFVGNKHHAPVFYAYCIVFLLPTFCNFDIFCTIITYFWNSDRTWESVISSWNLKGRRTAHHPRAFPHPVTRAALAHTVWLSLSNEITQIAIFALTNPHGAITTKARQIRYSSCLSIHHPSRYVFFDDMQSDDRFSELCACVHTH